MPPVKKEMQLSSAILNWNTKRLAQLPDLYTTLRPVILPKTEPPLPPL